MINGSNSAFDRVPPERRGGWVERKARLDVTGYYGMIENLDANIGRLRTALRELGIDRETYLVFFSDYGDCLGSHGQWEKSSPWEEAVRIPFVIATVARCSDAGWLEVRVCAGAGLALV